MFDESKACTKHIQAILSKMESFRIPFAGNPMAGQIKTWKAKLSAISSSMFNAKYSLKLFDNVMSACGKETSASSGAAKSFRVNVANAKKSVARYKASGSPRIDAIRRKVLGKAVDRALKATASLAHRALAQKGRFAAFAAAPVLAELEEMEEERALELLELDLGPEGDLAVSEALTELSNGCMGLNPFHRMI
jgi:hypothetical protein